MSPVSVDDWHHRLRPRDRNSIRNSCKRINGQQCSFKADRQTIRREEEMGKLRADDNEPDNASEVRQVAARGGSSEKALTANKRLAKEIDTVAAASINPWSESSKIAINNKRRKKRVYRRLLSQNIELVRPDVPFRCRSGGPDIASQHRTNSRSSCRFVIRRSDTDHDVGVKMAQSTKSMAPASKKKDSNLAKKSNRKRDGSGPDRGSLRECKEKREITTKLNDNCRDSSSWLTNVVETQNESESDPVSSDDSVFIDGLPTNSSRWLDKATDSSTETKKHREFAGDCVTAATRADFLSGSSLVEISAGDPTILIKPDASDKRSFYRASFLSHFFRYPRFQMHSSSSSTIIGAGNQSTSSDSFDLNSNLSKRQLTGSGSQAKHSTSSLKLAIDNLRSIVEKNLIATMIGLYILVSLALIVALILPYVFNFTHQSSESPSFTPLIENLSGARMDQVSYSQKVIGLSDKQTHELSAKKMTDDKGTQTTPVDADLSPLTQASLSQQIISADILPLDAINETTSEHPTSAIHQEADDLYQRHKMAHNSTSNSHKRKSIFSNLWTVELYGQCQPLKVPFCSRSLVSLLGDTGISLGRAEGLSFHNRIVYDKTFLPNQFTRARQSQIEKALERYDPVIDIKCYALMPLFLCSIYVPKCVEVTNLDDKSAEISTIRQTGASSGNRNSTDEGDQLINYGRRRRPTTTPLVSSRSTTDHSMARLIPPCRSICKEALRKCMFFFEVISTKFLDQGDCDSLPESSDPSVCVGHLENQLLQMAASTQKCSDDEFRCSDGECISKKWRCDGFNDCTDRSDEINCSGCNASSQFYCGADVCINKEQVCNGIRDCRDGRDERQCLRLSEGISAKSNGRQQLQAWSAVKDTWVPVCGAHWSAMPISHEACQALGYSRANETLIVYGSPNGPHELMQRKANLTHPKALDRLKRSSSDPYAGHMDTGTGGSINASQRQDYLLNRRQRSPGGWFDVSSGDSSTQSDITMDDNEQLASIVEDVASGVVPQAKAPTKAAMNGPDVSTKVADHLVHYELVGAGSGAGQLTDAPTKNGERSVLSGRQAKTNLASIDQAEIKLRSLTAILFYGPEAGCLGKPSQLKSSIHLQCENFQCGRPISSYSARVRLQQRLDKQSTAADSGEARRFPSLSAVPALRSFVGQQEAPKFKNEGDGQLITTERVQHLEAAEELHATFADDDDDDGHDDEDDDDPILGSSSSEYSHYGGPKRINDTNDRVRSSSGTKALVSSRWVVGGIESMPGEFPYLAALHGGPDEVFFCGGVLISINWLLTAAHCVGNRTQPDGWMVKVGVTRRIASPAYVKKLKVRKIIKHPNFNEGHMFNNDIALILLEKSVEFNQYLRPICLPRANSKLGPENSKDCVVVGFGKSKFSQEANYLPVAHFVNVPIVNQAICTNWYADQGVNLTKGMLCAGYAEGKRDACQGDSGSGLFCRYANTNQFFVAGVVSFGINCGNPKLPGVYTSVPLYVNWVEQVTRQHGYALT